MQDITKKKGVFKRIYLIILFFAFFIGNCLLPGDSVALIGIKEGDTPKKIVLEDLNGKIVDVSSYFGNRAVILVFWELTTDESFLNYSLNELRFLNNFYEKYHDKTGLEVFAIYTPIEESDLPDIEISAVQNLIITNKIKFPILIDKGFIFFREYGVIALPSTIMVNKSGKIQFIYPSFPIAARQLFSEQIRNLVGVTQVARKKEGINKKGTDSHSKRLYRYALQMYKRGLLEQALSPLKKSLEMDPGYTWSHNLMGIIMWQRGSFDRSTEEFKTAIGLDRNNIAAHLNYTALLIHQGNYDEAEKILVTSPYSEKFKARAHYMLGFVYEKTDRIDGAIKELEFAYSLLEKRDPAIDELTSPYYNFAISILHDLSELYNKKGNEKKALELLHKAFHYVLGIKGRSDTEHFHWNKDLMIYE